MLCSETIIKHFHLVRNLEPFKSKNMVPIVPDPVQEGKIKIPDVQKPPRWKSPTSEQVRHCQINCTNTLEVRVCNIQPIQRSHGQSGFQLHRLYPKYHKVKTNRKGQFVSGSFLNIPLLLQSQGIGTFPAWKMQSTKETTTLKYSGSSVPQQNHKVMKVMKESSMSNYNKARLKKLIFGETPEFQHHWSQGTKYQLQMLNKYLNFISRNLKRVLFVQK